MVVIFELPEIQSDRLHDGIGRRPLQGKERRPVTGILERDIRRERRLEPADHRFPVGGIHHQQEPVFKPIDEQVLHNAALFVEQAGVECSTRLGLVHVTGQLMLQEIPGSSSRKPQFTHVAHVEQADGRPDGLVLLAQARILDGHLMARKRDHLGTGGHMQWIQGGAGQVDDRGFHEPKVGGLSTPDPKESCDLSPRLPPSDEIASVQRDVILADRATTSIERIIRQLQGASLIGAERAKDEMIARIRSLASNAMPADARKAKFDTVAEDIWSVLAHNHRIYYLVEERRVIVLDVILDAEIHSVEAD